MVCHWKLKTLEVLEEGHQMHLKGIKPDKQSFSTVSPNQVAKWHKGNDIWAMAMVQQAEDPVAMVDLPSIIQKVLSAYHDVFATPVELPSHREYDHAIPLIPGAVPVSSRPYKYSPLHKDEIER
jgi:hypothetical protein